MRKITVLSTRAPSITEVEQLRARLKNAEAKLKALNNGKNPKTCPPVQDADSSALVLDAILNAVPHPIFWKDRHSVFQGCNVAFANEIGCRPKDIIGKTDADLTAETMKKHLHAQDTQVIKSGHSIINSQPIETMRNGKLKLESISKVPLYDSAGNTVGMLGTFRDVTAQKLAEEALHSSEKRFSAAFEGSASGMALVGASDGVWIRVNKVMCDMLGYTQEEFECKTIYDMTHTDDLEISQDCMQGLLSGRKPADCLEKRFIHKNGQVVWTQVNEALIQDEQDQSTYLVAQIHDITKRKKAEAELEKMHRRLLEYAREAGMAEVATSVLHNVGNVLNSISVSSSLASEKIRGSQISNLTRAVALIQENKDNFAKFIKDDPKGRRLPDYLSKLSSYLSDEQQEVIDELEDLDYNIQHVKQVISMQQNYAGVAGVTEEMDICELGADSLRLNMRSLDRHAVHVELDFKPVPLVVVEKHKVLQILVNLVQNARLALCESEQKNRLLTLRVRGDQDHVRISVIDNGIGIDPEVQSQLFDFGFTTRADGLGIGLHSSALAAREMGGALSAHSDGPGFGATFTLELPCTPDGETA